jgi:general secretion pathway protein F
MQFDLKVLNARQELAFITLDAGNVDEATVQAQHLGHVVLSVKRSAIGFTPSRHKRGGGFPLVLFSQELLSLLDAGLNLMEAMQTLQEKEHRPAARRVLDQVVTALNEGLPLSQALDNTNGIFPPLYIALVRSSEQSGQLTEALARFVDYQTQVDSVR